MKDSGRQNGENTPKLEVLNEVLVHCNLIKKRCQIKLKSFLYIYTKLEIILSTFKSKFTANKIWFYEFKSKE